MFNCLFSQVSSRKDRHGGTEKLCLLTGMSGPSGGGCGRAVKWPAAALGVVQAETLRWACACGS